MNPKSTKGLQANSLSYSRSDRLLFHDFDCEVNFGEVLLVQGPNGSGKTTLLRLLAGLMTPDAGGVYWRGESIQTQRELFHRELLYMGHLPAIKASLTVLENLHFMTAYTPRRDMELELALSKVGLAGYANVLAAHLSAGQQRRIVMAVLLIQDVVIWILDEPLTALDQSASQLLQELIQIHVEKQGMAIVSSHQPISLNCKKVELLLC